MTWAAVSLACLASALLALPQVSTARMATSRRTGEGATAFPMPDGPLAAAAALDALAACLRAGMAVSGGAAAVADGAPPALSAVLRRGADLLALGADPVRAWADPAEGGGDSPGDATVRAYLRMARRSAASGAALAHGVEDLAATLRAEAVDAAGARAERAAVLIAGPLGLCYLPAFLCLGIVPVVAGLAGDVLRSGVL
ncbi:type II secretion system F family protein [Mycolicibacterium sp. 018/SC-01/001]|uniref:type II secretion system F family protein n=1 Tax=Mycolicibacterium sp. 018/SC-01/001 TaxID=2592069 RepID=UPI00117D87B1|nr:type II secretion system F family protein [Mycolicibacterium sp. 018/SC-01/001]TRW80075.1 type II secretion system F family protein [Mycolicibacterium sp. 018/SC-01/001]